MSSNLYLGETVLSEVEEIARAEHYKESDKSLSKDMMVKAILIKSIQGLKITLGENELVWAGFAWGPKSGRKHMIVINFETSPNGGNSNLWKKCKAFPTEHQLVRFLTSKARVSQSNPLELGRAVFGSRAWLNCPVRNKANHHYIRLVRGVEIGLPSSDVAGGILFGTITDLSPEQCDDIGIEMSGHFAKCAQVFSMQVSELQNQIVSRILLENISNCAENIDPVTIRQEKKSDANTNSALPKWSSDEVDYYVSRIGENWLGTLAKSDITELTQALGTEMSKLTSLADYVSTREVSLQKTLSDGNLPIQSDFKNIFKCCAYNLGGISDNPGFLAAIFHLKTISDYQILIDACSAQESMFIDDTVEVVVFSDIPTQYLGEIELKLKNSKKMTWKIVTK